MKIIGFALVANATSIVLAGLAGYLLLNDKTGWVWFLAGAILTHASIKWTER